MAINWKQNQKQIELNNSLQIRTWRQVLVKEQKSASKKTKAEYEALKDQLDNKNTYLHHFKSPEKKLAETTKEMQAKSALFVYDQVKADTVPQGYNQKIKKDSCWQGGLNKQLPKQESSAPLTTSQQYGWRAPIDDMKTDFKRTGMCKRTFFDKGHLS